MRIEEHKIISRYMITISSVLESIFNRQDDLKKWLPGPKNVVGDDDDGYQKRYG